MATKEEVCSFRYDHDPVTLAPRGRACESIAVEEIHWKGGKVSVACSEHGLNALADDAKALVVLVVGIRSAAKADDALISKLRAQVQAQNVKLQRIREERTKIIAQRQEARLQNTKMARCVEALRELRPRAGFSLNPACSAIQEAAHAIQEFDELATEDRKR